MDHRTLLNLATNLSGNMEQLLKVEEECKFWEAVGEKEKATESFERSQKIHRAISYLEVRIRNLVLGEDSNVPKYPWMAANATSDSDSIISENEVSNSPTG